MLNTHLIHPGLLRVLSLCGQGDKVLIADGNYPLSSKTGNAEKLWLGLSPGLPTVANVLRALQSVIPVEKAEVIDPENGTKPEAFEEFAQLLGNMPLSKLGRWEFCDNCCDPCVRLAISTGETRAASSLLITVGAI